MDFGINNLSYAVTGSAGRYLLRIYQNTADSDRIRYEHDLLRELGQMVLSFSVPVPVVARSGETIVPAGTGSDAAAALFPFIPGRNVRQDDPPEVFAACGAALAELDSAFARLTLPPPTTVAGRFGDLNRWHPAVPDPLAMIAELPIDEGKRGCIARIIEEILAAVPDLYATLPVQIVHRDYDGTNTLVEDSRVCAILDFEFAAPDLRAPDLAVALLQFAPLPPDEVAVLSLSAVAAGYLGRLPLLPAELAAMPRLMVLYRSMSLVNRAGRFRLGLAQEVGVLARVDALLRIYDWLRDRPHDLEMVLNPR